VGGWGSRVHHGDEFFGFGMVHFPSAIVFVPLSKLLDLPTLNSEWGFRIFVAVGFVLWAGFGWLLDRVRAWRWMYVLMPVVFVVIVLSRRAVPPSIPPIADYPGQEWEWPSVFVAYCWAVYAVALVFLLLAAVAIFILPRFSRCSRYTGF
jgi:hypothetical protein